MLTARTGAGWGGPCHALSSVIEGCEACLFLHCRFWWCMEVCSAMMTSHWYGGCLPARRCSPMRTVLSTMHGHSPRVWSGTRRCISAYGIGCSAPEGPLCRSVAEDGRHFDTTARPAGCQCRMTCARLTASGTPKHWQHYCTNFMLGPALVVAPFLASPARHAGCSGDSWCYCLASCRVPWCGCLAAGSRLRTALCARCFGATPRLCLGGPPVNEAQALRLAQTSHGSECVHLPACNSQPYCHDNRWSQYHTCLFGPQRVQLMVKALVLLLYVSHLCRALRHSFTAHPPIHLSRFLERNELDLVVRSHEVKEEGYEVEHGGRLITVFSAPNYVDTVRTLARWRSAMGPWSGRKGLWVKGIVRRNDVAGSRLMRFVAPRAASPHQLHHRNRTNRTS